MVDRFNRLFMRTLRSLRDLRRYSPSVVVQNVGQLNLGQTQLNIGQAGAPSETCGGGPIGTTPETAPNHEHEG